LLALVRFGLERIDRQERVAELLAEGVVNELAAVAASVSASSSPTVAAAWVACPPATARTQSRAVCTCERTVAVTFAARSPYARAERGGAVRYQSESTTSVLATATTAARHTPT